MKKTPFALGILTLALLSSCKKDMNTSVPPADADVVTTADKMFGPQTTATYVPGELLVKFKTGTLSTGRRASALARINASVEEEILTPAMRSAGDEGFVLVRTSMDVMDALRSVKGNSDIEYAEPNWIYTYGAASNDPYFTAGYLWGMNGTYGCNASTAWAAGHTGSSTVYVGVIDEGAMYSHPDLQGNFGNPREIAGNGRDDDGNGYVDDAYGWDFVSNNNSTYDGTADDHGTHVAGTIGAVGGNATGVAGVCWSVKMISAKFLGTNGGTTANAIKAIDYITNLKTRDGLNIVATNNSWGGGGFSQALQDAITRANNANILFIAAAGNNGSDNNSVPNYPSNYTNANVIAVAAIASNGTLASFSNYGATTVDIGAPGVGIYSTLPGSSGATYGSYSGTSMATPHVTGAAALYASTHPGATAAQIKAAILNTGTPTPSLTGKCVTGKRLNVSSF